MTNEQLKILLESQALLLEEIIEKSAELMPENAAREMKWCYIGGDAGFVRCASAMRGAAAGYENNPDYEQKPTGRHIALIPLFKHLGLLQGQIMELGDDKIGVVPYSDKYK